MTNKKMQCYVKSVKTDTDSILKDLRPAIINFLSIFCVLIGAVFTLGIALTIITYSEPYIKVVFEAICSLFTVLLSPAFVTQYNVYLLLMIILDLVIFCSIRETMVVENEDPSDRSPYSQTLGSILFLVALFALNSILVIISWDSTKPELVVGWSFMICETIINMVGVVVGILLYRAYLKCENKIVPANPSDWDSLDGEL